MGGAIEIVRYHILTKMPLSPLNPDLIISLHPVFLACRKGDEAAVRNYLADGVGVDISDPNHASLIATAIEGGYPKIVRLLLEFGLDPNKEINRFGETPLLRALAEKNLNVIRELINGGASINKPDPRGFTPIMSAAAGGVVEVLELLTSLGADLSAQNMRGRTVFTEAVCANKLAVMEWLKGKGLDIEHRDSQGTTPLIAAAKSGQMDACKWLLEHGADINAEDQRGKTALDWAKTNGHAKVGEVLRKHLGN